MRATVRTLFEGIIDYAGLFPPAERPLDAAVEEYLDWLGGPDRWIVARFVCPSAKLDALATALEQEALDEELEIAVTSPGGNDLAAFESALELDAQRMTAFESRMEGRAAIGAFEVRLPRLADLDQALDDLEHFDTVEVYAEGAWNEELSETVAAIAETEWVGAKGRTGSMRPDEVPSSLQLAEFLKSCLDLDLEFKLTAGLHEPLRHVDTQLGVPVHGFLNVALACAQHLTHDLSVDALARLLERTQLDFEAAESHVILDGETIDLGVLEDVRSRWRSFGSCSVSEPLEGIARLGLIGAAR